MKIFQSVIAGAVSISSSLVFVEAVAIEYDVELIEPVPLSGTYLDAGHNDRGDYYVARSYSLFSARTIAVIEGVRYDLPFFATDLNNVGQLCGGMPGRVNWPHPVTWSASEGFVQLNTRGTVAYAAYINDIGEVGGSLNWYGSPCLWRNGVAIIVPANSGYVTATHPSGMIAGYFGDGGHGNYSWYYDKGVLVYTTPGIYVAKIDPERRIVGGTSASYSGRALVYDFGNITYLPGGVTSWIADMNDVGTGIGVVGGPMWENLQPAIWFRTGTNTYEFKNPYDLLSLRHLDKLNLIDVTEQGLIFASARLKGEQWLVRLIPRE